IKGTEIGGAYADDRGFIPRIAHLDVFMIVAQSIVKCIPYNIFGVNCLCGGAKMVPLDGIRVLDFSTLLPGPLAGLMLAQAGAEVIKVERPGTGDDMRGYEPRVGGTG